MQQGELEEKVREIFEDQGFEVEKENRNKFHMENGDSKKVQVFSSSSYSSSEVLDEVEEGSLVFLDEDLSSLVDDLDNEVSVIREREDSSSFDLPSYEIIGDIAVLNEIDGRGEEDVVEGILEHHPHIKTVLLKESPLEGEYRVGGYGKLYGEETETVHKEFGCRYLVDPTKVYFSERLATERKRVVDQIEPGEDVLVMFAGVGPYAILAAKRSEPGRVVAVEKNPEAADYLKENIDLNDVGNVVEGFEGDVRSVLKNFGDFDRVVMPLPGSADDFLDLAFEHLGSGGVVHYYRFLEGDDWEGLVSEVEEFGGVEGEDFVVLDRVRCGQRGPNVDRVCLDIKKK